MSALDDLIKKIPDDDLRERIATEFRNLRSAKKFGLVFEEQLPEVTRLYDVPITRDSLVVMKADKNNDIYRVVAANSELAVCIRKIPTGEVFRFKLDEIVAVAKFGDPIFPSLQKLDAVCNAPDSDLWHVLIEADNYHALQLLRYTSFRKVDCIYIDPPYNTGARDWKYNNDYVDSSDAFRHSKWLSMMKRRLQLAKMLLNPKDSVLIVTIDEHEYLSLGWLLKEIFRGANIQMVSTVINPAGVSRDKEFYRMNEYLFFVKIGNAAPEPLELDQEWRGKIKGGLKDRLRWNGLQRFGIGGLREDSPNLFYPVYLDKTGKKILGVGDSIPLNVPRDSVEIPDDVVAVWPVSSDGREGRWRLGRETFLDMVAKHFVKIGKFRGDQTAISYLSTGERVKVENGDFPIVGYAENGSVIVDESQYTAKFIPGNQWWISTHNATQHGTKLLNAIIGSGKFMFPKSLYAVRDCLKFFVANKPDALIVDFFAGSGTTMHAVNLLNAEDGGHRRCILVTNNEVSAEEEKRLRAAGHNPGSEEWSRLGVARYVTWQRIVCSIEGHDVNGVPLKGNYLGSEIPMADGFKANAIFFKLGFVEQNMVWLGRRFKEILPLLWLKAGGYGKCPEPEGDSVPPLMILPENRFALLSDESRYLEFEDKVYHMPELETLYIVTNSHDAFVQMIRKFHARKTFQLYDDYLDDFELNIDK